MNRAGRGPLDGAAAAAAAVALAGLLGGSPAAAQDYEREQRWAEQTLKTLDIGEAVSLQQQGGHRFLGLYTRAATPRGAALVIHGRGWGPDYDLYGDLRTRLAEAGYATLSIQMPVLTSAAKIGDYLPTFPDADERIALSLDWLRARGFRNVAIVSHSLGSTMANHYLIRNPDAKAGAWVMLGIINGLEDMFRIRIPVLDVYAERDWDVTRVGAGERLAQITKIRGSGQVVIADTGHFFDGRREELSRTIVEFLGRVLPQGMDSKASPEGPR